ncbi:response regulator transcription factor [Gaetbulibacter saemankumensis]|uniref:response regulator transcription factor n=1 Tax=Gaetbulibacter saemankumensis TaxID=311208 RepID=UPI0004851C2D|nr:helix-turn-helix transcriptional regulator [Gaetbulibacter saemankumensis]
MKIYQGPFLSITYEKENSLLVQNWSRTLSCVEHFKSEMLMFVKCFVKYKPKYVLWLQYEFSLIIDKETYLWIEDNVNVMGIKYGIEKVAFVVGKDVFAHVTVIDSFEEVKSALVTRHFLTELDARAWLFETTPVEIDNKKPKIVFLGSDENDDFIFKIENTRNHVSEALKLFKSSVEQQQFTKLNLGRFSELTKREKQVLKLVAEGKSNDDIGNELFISAHTARTHWRNIKTKLNIKQEKDIDYYNKILEIDTPELFDK